jgi:hypothetical protein
MKWQVRQELGWFDLPWKQEVVLRRAAAKGESQAHFTLDGVPHLASLDDGVLVDLKSNTELPMRRLETTVVPKRRKDKRGQWVALQDQDDADVAVIENMGRARETVLNAFASCHALPDELERLRCRQEQCQHSCLAPALDSWADRTLCANTTLTDKQAMLLRPYIGYVMRFGCDNECAVFMVRFPGSNTLAAYLPGDAGVISEADPQFRCRRN